MNYKCPCCQFPLLSPGRIVQERLFGEKLIELQRDNICKNCKTEFTATFRVGKSNSEYVSVEYSNIIVRDNIIRAINMEAPMTF